VKPPRASRRPALLNGKPVPMAMTVTVNAKLRQAPPGRQAESAGAQQHGVPGVGL